MPRNVWAKWKSWPLEETPRLGRSRLLESPVFLWPRINCFIISIWTSGRGRLQYGLKYPIYKVGCNPMRRRECYTAVARKSGTSLQLPRDKPAVPQMPIYTMLEVLNTDSKRVLD